MAARPDRVFPVFACIIALTVSAIAVINYRDMKLQAEALAEVLAMSLSDEPDVRAGAIGVASRHFLDDRLPSNMYVQLITSARTSSEEEVRRAVSQGLWQITQERGHENVFTTELKKSRPFLDVRYPEGTNKDLLKKFVDVLRSETFSHGPFLIGTKSMVKVDKPEIRCFYEQCENASFARDVSAFLREAKFDLELNNKSKILRQPLLYTNAIEIWLTAENLALLDAVATRSANTASNPVKKVAKQK